MLEAFRAVSRGRPGLAGLVMAANESLVPLVRAAAGGAAWPRNLAVAHGDPDAAIALNGWVNTYRDQGRGLLFIDLRDRDGLCQVVFDLEQGHPDVVRTAKALRREDV
ncbi:MAG: OB-fold nucleic acid binding domain-containing protein, partial [Phycisphaerales bacterium]